MFDAAKNWITEAITETIPHYSHEMPVMSPVVHAQAYETMTHEPDRDNVSDSYKMFIMSVCRQYDVLRSAGLEIDWVAGEPYESSEAMRHDVLVNKHLSVRLTSPESGEYDDLPDKSHPLAATVTTFGVVVSYNDLFRAVHDVLGHTLSNSGFGPDGELVAWLTHRTMFPVSALTALWCETRGQTAWVNDFADHRSLPLKSRPFPAQKCGSPKYALALR